MISRIIAFFLALLTFFGGAFNTYRPGKETEFTADYPSGERDMEKYHGIYSRVGDCGGVPTLFINGEAFPAAAYMTYLEELNNYSGFAQAGYCLFSVPVLFAGRWISAMDMKKPFHAGIFDTKGQPDFSTLDSSVERILSACPDAFIIPRVNLSMPLWWIEENPDCLDGTGKRESLFSEKFRQTAADMLREVIEHVNSSDYAENIAGYHIAGGNTEEWFHFDMNAGYCQTAESAFNAYLDKYYPGCGFSGLPDLSLLNGKGSYHKNEHLVRYLEFASNAVADDICYFCSVAKEATGNNLAVGTFYGYSLEVTGSLHGTHALKTVLECESVDFISSPNSYIGTRNNNIDWTEMYPADSVRLHGKVCLQECDIRTYLTRLLSDCAPEYDEGKLLSAEVWRPLENREQSISAVRKSFSRQLIKGNGFWWFDMWGGWYNDPVILGEMREMRNIYASSLNNANRASVAEVAAFVDESAYKYMTDCSLRGTAFNMRESLGFAGAPYDLYDISDFEAVYKKYKAVVFLSDLKTEYMTRALDLCKKDGVKYISTSDMKKKYTPSELRAFYEANGVHIFCETDDVVYVNDNFVAVHATEAGTKKIYFDGGCSYRELLCENGIEGTGGVMSVPMEKNETKLFEIKR